VPPQRHVEYDKVQLIHGKCVTYSQLQNEGRSSGIIGNFRSVSNRYISLLYSKYVPDHFQNLITYSLIQNLAISQISFKKIHP